MVIKYVSEDEKRNGISLRDGGPFLTRRNVKNRHWPYDLYNVSFGSNIMPRPCKV